MLQHACIAGTHCGAHVLQANDFKTTERQLDTTSTPHLHPCLVSKLHSPIYCDPTRYRMTLRGAALSPCKRCAIQSRPSRSPSPVVAHVACMCQSTCSIF